MQGSPEFRDIATVILRILGTLYASRNLFAVSTWWRDAVIRHWAPIARHRFLTFESKTVYAVDVKLARAMSRLASDAVLVSFGVLWEHAEILSARCKEEKSPLSFWTECCGYFTRAHYHAFYDGSTIVYPPRVRIECNDGKWRHLLALRSLKNNDELLEFWELVSELRQLKFESTEHAFEINETLWK